MIFFFFFYSIFAKEIFTGNKLIDDIVEKSKFNILIDTKCPKCKEITELCEKAHIDYNVVQTYALV
jgi:phage FluMu protein Com